MTENSLTQIDKASFQLQGDLTIYETAQVRMDILAHLNSAEHLDLDLSHVAEIDTSGIQLLLSLKKEPHKVFLKNPAQSVMRLVQLLRLEKNIPELFHSNSQATQQ